MVISDPEATKWRFFTRCFVFGMAFSFLKMLVLLVYVFLSRYANLSWNVVVNNLVELLQKQTLGEPF